MIENYFIKNRNHREKKKILCFYFIDRTFQKNIKKLLKIMNLLINLIITFVVNPLLSFFNIAHYILDIINATLDYWRSEAPFMITILNEIKYVLYVSLRVFNIAWNGKFIMLWFPSVNPYIAPFYTITYVTKPYITFIQKYMRPILGMDFSYMVGGFILRTAIKCLENYSF